MDLLKMFIKKINCWNLSLTQGLTYNFFIEYKFAEKVLYNIRPKGD